MKCLTRIKPYSILLLRQNIAIEVVNGEAVAIDVSKVTHILPFQSHRYLEKVNDHVAHKTR
jgi:hypothetical protein